MADQLGPPDALDYALKLKDCEDAQDHLLRLAQRISKRIGTRRSDIGDTFLIAVDTLANPNTTEIAVAKERIRLLTAANFALGQWSSFTESNDTDLFMPDSIGRHLRYPVNHFMGTLLVEVHTTSAPSLRITRVLGLANLRALVKSSSVAENFPLIRHHAIHMLARYGDVEDRATVQDLILQQLGSEDRLSRKLAFSGLIMAQGAESEIADEYLYELTHDPELAAVDLAFDATHYGDLPLGVDSQLRRLDSFAPMLIQNIVHHYMRPQLYGRLADIDAFRALSTLDFCRPSDVPKALAESLISCFESGVIRPSSGTFQRMLSRNLSQLPELPGSSRPAFIHETVDIPDRSDVKSNTEYDVFISYSSDDEAFVRNLDKCLERKGLKCWVDFRNIPLGRLHQESMQNGLASSKACIVVLGRKIGNWQRLELQAAIAEFVETNKPVVPFVISGSTMPRTVPAFLREFAGVLLDRYGSLDLACSAIVTRLAHH